MERLWLTAAERQLALHPMTALPYLFHSRGDSSLEADTQETLQELYPRYQKLFSVPDSSAHAFLFRLSFAEETTWRSLRRHLEDILVIL